MTAVDIEYQLTEEEVFTAYYNSGMYRSFGRRALVQDIAIFAFAIYFFVMFYINRAPSNIVFGLLCLIVFGVVKIVPRMQLKKQSREIADGRTVKMHFLPTKIIVSDGEETWEIKLDKSCGSMIVDDRLILIKNPRDQLVVLPVRAIPRNLFEDIQDIIFEGTV